MRKSVYLCQTTIQILFFACNFEELKAFFLFFFTFLFFQMFHIFFFTNSTLGCQCNNQATSCDRETGDCYCFTKGVVEKNCSQCDGNYVGDPANGQPCFCKCHLM